MNSVESPRVVYTGSVVRFSVVSTFNRRFKLWLNIRKVPIILRNSKIYSIKIEKNSLSCKIMDFSAFVVHRLFWWFHCFGISPLTFFVYCLSSPIFAIIRQFSWGKCSHGSMLISPSASQWNIRIYLTQCVKSIDLTSYFTYYMTFLEVNTIY